MRRYRRLRTSSGQSLSQYCNSVDKVPKSARVISASIKNVVNRVYS